MYLRDEQVGHEQVNTQEKYDRWRGKLQNTEMM